MRIKKLISHQLSINRKVKQPKKYEISIALVAAVSAQKNWFTKEWQVTAADQAGEEIILSDPSIRSGKQWHDCGAKPPMPWISCLVSNTLVREPLVPV